MSPTMPRSGRAQLMVRVDGHDEAAPKQRSSPLDVEDAATHSAKAPESDGRFLAVATSATIKIN